MNMKVFPIYDHLYLFSLLTLQSASDREYHYSHNMNMINFKIPCSDSRCYVPITHIKKCHKGEFDVLRRICYQC